MHYNEQAGALVLGGVNSESRYDQLSSCRDDPIVLFAIDLTPGRTDKLLTDKDCPDAFRPLWYRFLTPHDSTCEFTLKRCAPNTAIRSREPLFEVSFEPHDQLRGSTYAFYLSMNFDGNIVGRTIDTAVSSSIGIDIDAIGFVDAGILIKR